MASIFYDVEKNKVTKLQEYISMGSPIDAINPDGDTLLFIASFHNSLECLQKLIKVGAKLTSSGDRFTPLHAALIKKDQRCIRELFNASKYEISSLYVTSIMGNALHYAAIGNNVEIIRELLTLNLPIDGLNQFGRSPLLEAARASSFEALCELLAQKASVNLTDTQGYTALHFAASTGNLNAVKELLKYGAQLDVTNNNGDTPLALASGYNDSGIPKLDSNDEQYSCLHELIKQGASVSIANNKGMTPLHIAASFGLSKSIKALIQAKAPLNVKTLDGHTPLHLALRDLASTKLLIEAGANFEIPNNYGQTALDLVRNDHWRYEIAQYLYEISKCTITKSAKK